MPMFSLAVSVPPGAQPDSYDLTRVPDLGQNVKNTILQCGVYAGDNVVAATLLRWPDVAQRCPRSQVPWQDVLQACGRESMTWHEVAMICPGAVEDNRADHAEYRVLERFNSWAEDKDKSGLLVFYAYAAPCTSRCASKKNALSILKLLERIQEWKEHVVVFSKLLNVKTLWVGTSIPVDQLTRALVNLGRHLGTGGLGRIFRCDRPQDDNSAVECISCSAGGQVTPQCYKKDGESGEAGQDSGRQGGGGAVRGGHGIGGAVQGAQRGSGAVREGQEWAQGVGAEIGEWQTVGQRRRGPLRGAQGTSGAVREGQAWAQGVGGAIAELKTVGQGRGQRGRGAVQGDGQRGGREVQGGQGWGQGEGGTPKAFKKDELVGPVEE
ncbi:uncharacterized protein LOC133476913 [Phyllopteryx taeniolatus]|uniref:uncharacterized protein LOC133476913 n=1 Tax=Phyllopteryx taeniolatus TaxID=161469 RepID=UPI002AD2BEBF|nr:uncharacterized protein LOC133476913 [Phyllopteryx taeniolatus]